MFSTPLRQAAVMLIAALIICFSGCARNDADVMPAGERYDASDFLEGYSPLADTPTEYAEIIECFRKSYTVFYNILRGDYDDELVYELLYGSDPISFESVGIYPNTMALYDICGFEPSQLGYAVYDINGDGIDELLILYINDSGIQELSDIFSFCCGRAKHLLGFRSRDRCTGVSEDGHIFNCGTGGAACNYYYCFTISPGGETLDYEVVHHCGWEEYEYTYCSRQDYDPDTPIGEEEWTPIPDEDGEQLVSRLTYGDYADDDAPFVEFVPMF